MNPTFSDENNANAANGIPQAKPASRIKDALRFAGVPAGKAPSVGGRVLGALVPFGAAIAALYPVAIVAAVVLIGLTAAGPAA